MVRELVIQPPLFLPSLALDSGTPCRNDEVETGRLHHLEFSHHPFKNRERPSELCFHRLDHLFRGDAEGLVDVSCGGGFAEGIESDDLALGTHVLGP